MDIPVCHIADLELGEMLRYDPPGIDPIAVFHIDEGFYALDDLCSHQDASLVDGWLEGCEVECPLHGACFDVRTGEPTNYPDAPAKDPVRSYAVRVEDEQIIVEISEK